MRALSLILTFMTATLSTTSATEEAFPQTKAGDIEIKTIPASRLIMAESNSGYFDANNGLFQPLFRYISQNDIKMTSPVEAEIDPGKMYFYIGRDAADRDFQSTRNVTVIEKKERIVASIGVRGGYSRKNFENAQAELEAWLAKHPTHQAAGQARGVYWNGPFTPGFLKRFEVHIPVAPRKLE